jgi:hemolysin activation/secretion protein
MAKESVIAAGHHLRRPAENQTGFPEYLPEKPETGFHLPPAPSGPDALAGGPGFKLKGVLFEGNTVFSDEELSVLSAPFVGQQTGVAELEELRYRLTRHYVDEGYINSGALLKAGQKVDDGVVVYEIVEGRLNDIHVRGNGRLSCGYVQKRLWPEPDEPLNTEVLQERFLLLLQDPLIRKLDGRIHPGSDPRQALLDLNVSRKRPYGANILFDNHNPPSTGAVGCTFSAWVRNLNGYGDLFELSYGKCNGSDRYDADYGFILNRHHTRLSLGYRYTENAVVEEPLRSIDVESESETLEIALNQPLMRTVQRNLEMGLVLSRRKTRTFLLGQPFSFSEGEEDGESRVSVIRLIQSFTDRTVRQALALRSTFSWGVDMFGATAHSGDRTDGQFFAWLGQFQYARRIGKNWGSLMFRGDLQLASDKLLALEQFALGGANTVRGYRENERVRDNGYDVSVEWRYPLWRNASAKKGDRLLQTACFTDFGVAWDKGEDASWNNRLHAVGLGLLWTNDWMNAEVYWAQDIKTAVSKDEHDLQDNGIHFQMSMNF